MKITKQRTEQFTNTREAEQISNKRPISTIIYDYANDNMLNKNDIAKLSNVQLTLHESNYSESQWNSVQFILQTAPVNIPISPPI